MRRTKLAVTLAIVSMGSANLAAAPKCLYREGDAKIEKMQITDFANPSHNIITIMTSNTDADCASSLCDIRVGDQLEFGREIIWKRNGGKNVLLNAEAQTGGTGTTVRYLRLRSQESEDFIFYLLQSASTADCPLEKTKQCKTYYFEAFRTLDDARYSKPEKGEFLDPSDCTEWIQPGTGGGTEPPP